MVQMKMSGSLLKLGETLSSGEIISPDCKIRVNNAIFEHPVTLNFDSKNKIGWVSSIKYETAGDNLIGIDVEVYFSKDFPEGIISFEPGGTILKRRNNQIEEFELIEVSLCTKK